MSASAPLPQRKPTVQELFDLTGRVAIVTGAGSGIGTQMARALAEMGADLVLCARDAKRCEQAAAELSASLGVRAVGLRCDVASPEEVRRMVASTRAELGRVDVLVNNSGTTWGASPEEHSLDGWQKVIGVNLTGAFLCAQEAGRVMLDQGSGKIVNIASVAGLRGAPPAVRQAAAYSASKGGLLALTRDLACSWGARGINVNAIAPGWFRTAIADEVLGREAERIAEGIPLGRVGGPHDLKGAVAFLSSRASDHVTGQTLVVDGGKTAW